MKFFALHFSRFAVTYNINTFSLLVYKNIIFESFSLNDNFAITG